MLLDIAALAAERGARSQPLEREDDRSRLFVALAAQDPARMALIWLRYRVHH